MNRKRKRSLGAFKRRLGMAETDNLQSLQQEYQMLCAKAGELQYQAKQINNLLNQANQKLEQVNKKYAALKEAQPTSPEAPAEVAPIPTPEVTDAIPQS